MIKKVLFIFFIINVCYGQKWNPYEYYGPQKEFLGNRISLNNNSFQKLQMKVYTPSLKITKKYKSQIEVDNTSIEGLLSSIFSAYSQDWIDYNTYLGASKSRKVDKMILDKIKIASIENNYLLVSSILCFEANGLKHCIVKFKIISEDLPKPMAGTYLLVNVEGRWYQHVSNFFATNLSIMLLSFDDTKFLKILKGKQTEDPNLNALIDKVYDNNSLNLNKLFDIYNSWYLQNDSDNKKHFLDKQSWTF